MDDDPVSIVKQCLLRRTGWEDDAKAIVRALSSHEWLRTNYERQMATRPHPGEEEWIDR